MFEDLDLDFWPNCITPDCEFKCCTWSETPYCHHCAKARLGEAEMIRLYNASHDITWEEAMRLDREEDEAEKENA